MPTLKDITLSSEEEIRLIREYGGESIYIPKRIIDRPAIRAALASGDRPCFIARKYNISMATVYRSRKDES